MKLIELTQGRVAIVDDEDFDWLSKWKWCYWRAKKTGYATRTDYSGSKQKSIWMHVAVMQHHRLWKRGKEVDHENTCGCDNRKSNLRIPTSSGQQVNTGLRTNNTSGVAGVNWDKEKSKWQTRISTNGKRKHLGYYVDLNEAIKVRQKAEVKHYGKFRHDPTNVCPLGRTGQCPDCAERLK